MKGVGWAFALLLSFGSILTTVAEDFPVRQYSFGSAAIGRDHHDHAIRHSIHRDRLYDETAAADLSTLKPEAIDMLESDVMPKDKVLTEKVQAEALSSKKRHDKNLRSQAVPQQYLQTIYYSSLGCVQTSTTTPPITSASATALNLCMQFSANLANSPYGNSFGNPAPSNRQFPTFPTYVMYTLQTALNPYSANPNSNPYLPNYQNPGITSNNYPIVIQEKFFSDSGCTNQLSLNPRTGYPGTPTHNFNITSGCQNVKTGGYSAVTGLNYFSVSSSIVQNVNVPESGLLVSRYEFIYCI